jgi:SAM-dependent methyltransferase
MATGPPSTVQEALTGVARVGDGSMWCTNGSTCRAGRVAAGSSARPFRPEPRTDGFKQDHCPTKRVACGFRNMTNYQRRPGDLSTQDGQLVTKDGDLHVLRIRCRTQHDQAQQPPNDHQTQRPHHPFHEHPRAASPLVTTTTVKLHPSPWRACALPGLVLVWRRSRNGWNAGAVTDHVSPEVHATVFGRAAAEYERGRPPYPPQAVDWLLPAGATRVLDLGAGTGKLTRQLWQRGLDVVAVEPSAGMREQLHQVLPDLDVRTGRAEAIPLDDSTVDVVLVAQAWHWVQVGPAVPEVARVLRPGGRLGLLWNVRDDRQDWVSRLDGILADCTKPDHNITSPQVGPPFGPLERHDVAWTDDTTPDGLLDLVASRSYVIVLPPEERAAVLARVRYLLTTHPSLAGRRHFSVPYVTRCFRTALPS